MPGEPEARPRAPAWVPPLLVLVGLVMFCFGLIAAMTGEWDVALANFGFLAVGIWVALTPDG